MGTGDFEAYFTLNCVVKHAIKVIKFTLFSRLPSLARSRLGDTAAPGLKGEASRPVVPGAAVSPGRLQTREGNLAHDGN